MRRRFWRRFGRAMYWTHRDGCFGIAKAAAYSALLSFLPMLGFLAALLAQFRAEAVSHVLARLVLGVVPPGTEHLVRQQFTNRGARPLSLLVAAALLSVWAASGVMASLMEGFHRAYKLPSGRSLVRERAVAILLVLVAALPAVGASVLMLLGTITERWLLSFLGVTLAPGPLHGWAAVSGASIRLAAVLTTVAVVTASLYRFGPARRQKWRGVWPGALLATALWLILTLFFSWYVRNIANYNLIYGGVGAVIALIVWMYLMAVIALVGCEFNAELDRSAPGSRI